MTSKLFISKHIFCFEELPSTNNYALELISNDKYSDGTVIMTNSQTKGRGQQTNVWESESGKNLTISLILKPNFVPVHEQFDISKIISLSIVDLIKDYCENVSVKWPNDIYIGDKKVAGILIEHGIMGPTLSHSICGIGLNINQEEFLSNAPNPSSIKIESGLDFSVNEILNKLLDNIESRYFELKDYGNKKLSLDYLENLYRKDKYYKYEDDKGIFKAKIKGISEYGQYILEDTEGIERIYNFKEVRFL